MLESSV